MRIENPNRRAGLSLVEVAVVVAVGSILAVGVGSSVTSTMVVTSEITATSVLDGQMHRASSRFVNELRYADVSTLEVTENSVRFRPVTGWNGSAETGDEREFTIRDGQLLLDGIVITDRLSGGSFELNDSSLTISVEASKAGHYGGTEFERGLTTTVHFTEFVASNTGVSGGSGGSDPDPAPDPEPVAEPDPEPDPAPRWRWRGRRGRW